MISKRERERERERVNIFQNVIQELSFFPQDSSDFHKHYCKTEINIKIVSFGDSLFKDHLK